MKNNFEKFCTLFILSFILMPSITFGINQKHWEIIKAKYYNAHLMECVNRCGIRPSAGFSYLIKRDNVLNNVCEIRYLSFDSMNSMIDDIWIADDVVDSCYADYNQQVVNRINRQLEAIKRQIENEKSNDSCIYE
jgi:hypothetical protein